MMVSPLHWMLAPPGQDMTIEAVEDTGGTAEDGVPGLGVPGLGVPGLGVPVSGVPPGVVVPGDGAALSPPPPPPQADRKPAASSARQSGFKFRPNVFMMFSEYRGAAPAPVNGFLI